MAIHCDIRCDLPQYSLRFAADIRCDLPQYSLRFAAIFVAICRNIRCDLPQYSLRCTAISLFYGAFIILLTVTITFRFSCIRLPA
jgi:hypothetical protein